MVAASDAAGVDLYWKDVPVSGFPAVFGEGAPGKSGKFWSLSLVTFLRSLRAGMLLAVGEGVHGLRTWGYSITEPGRRWESSLAPAKSAPCPKRCLDLHSWSLFFREI